MKKEKIVFIIGVITIIIASTISVYAANYLYNSSEVSYDNKASNITSDNVQGAIDELYTEATNYNDLNTRITTLENTLNSNTDITTGSTGYYEFPNGLLIQWTEMKIPYANSYVCEGSWTFPKAFKSGCQVVATPQTAGANASSYLNVNAKVSATSKTSAKIQIHASSAIWSTSNIPTVRLIAIGY